MSASRQRSIITVYILRIVQKKLHIHTFIFKCIGAYADALARWATRGHDHTSSSFPCVLLLRLYPSVGLLY